MSKFYGVYFNYRTYQTTLYFIKWKILVLIFAFLANSLYLAPAN
jgi:hypothetical protein